MLAAELHPGRSTRIRRSRKWSQVSIQPPNRAARSHGPGGPAERARARDPDPAARVRRLQDRGRRSSSPGEMPEDEFIKFRLKQGVYGQRQPDVQMIRVKLPFGGVTPEQMEAFADVIEKYVPLNKGHITTRQNIQMHHIPLPDAEKRDPRARRRGPLEPRGLRQHGAQRHRRPVGGRGEGRAVRHDPLRRRIRALLRAPPHHAGDAAQDQDRVRRQRRATARSADIHDIAFRARVREIEDGGEVRGARDAGRRRHLDHAARGPDAVRLRRARQRRVPEGRRGRLADLRPPGVAARQPRARAHQGVRRQVRHRRAAQPGRGGAARATGSPNATSRSRSACSSTTSARARRAPPPSYGSPNGDLREFDRFRAANVASRSRRAS